MTNKEKITKETNEFIEEYLVDPTIDYTKEQIMDSLQEYLVTKGCGIDQFEATVEYVTDGGKGVDFKGFLQIEGNSNFATKLANMDVAKTYSYLATISGFAEPVGELYDNLSKLENYKNEDGSYTYEGNQLLEDSLYAFIEAVGEGANLIPGGFGFSTLANEIIPIIGDGIDTINLKIDANEFTKFGQYNDHYYRKYPSIQNNLMIGDWENGPSLEELEDIYNNCTDTDVFDEYLAWRIQYEFEKKLKEQDIDVKEYYDMMEDLNKEPSFWQKPVELKPIDKINYMNMLAFIKYLKTKFGEDEYVDDASSDAGAFSDDEILDFVENTSGIDTKKVIKKLVSEAKDSATKASTTKVDPIIFDLDGDGFNIETKEDGAYFDLDKNEFAERINWTKKDGFLCLDLNGNGNIDNGGELFGDNTLLADGTEAANLNKGFIFLPNFLLYLKI